MNNYSWSYPLQPGYYNELGYPYCFYPTNPYDYYNHSHTNDHYKPLKDHGKKPFSINIERATNLNNTFRTAIWTGEQLQVTLMSIDVGDDIGLEVHPETDQFLRMETGQALVQMGDKKDQLTYQRRVEGGSAIMVPAGKWHNLTNIGNQPIKLYTIYAPAEHKFGTVHQTKAEAIEAEAHHYD